MIGNVFPEIEMAAANHTETPLDELVSADTGRRHSRASGNPVRAANLDPLSRG